MAKLFANSGDPDQRQHSAGSDQSALFANYPLWFSRLKWVKIKLVNFVCSDQTAYATTSL